MSEADRQLYLARFEIVNWGAQFQYPEAVLQKAQQKGTVAGWIDFLVGFPLACVELLAMVGELSSIPDKAADPTLVEEVAGDGGYTPAFPKTLFGGYADNKTMVNLMWLDGDYSDTLPPDLQNESQPQGLHWWVRVAIMTAVGQKFPYPGEFMALACRIFLDRFVGFSSQESNPFLFSGQWLDTVFLTGGFITDIIEPTAEFPYNQYSIMWRKNPNNPNDTGIIQNVLPTDFAEYKKPSGDAKVGDRVAILKNITVTKQSQLWKDLDMTTFDVTTWAIAPFSFYNINPEAVIAPG